VLLRYRKLVISGWLAKVAAVEHKIILKILCYMFLSRTVKKVLEIL
jgi:hypothetical protein